MVKWCNRGFPELGDIGGMGRGMTTTKVLEHPYYLTDPHKVFYTHLIKIISNSYNSIDEFSLIFSTINTGST